MTNERLAFRILKTRYGLLVVLCISLLTGCSHARFPVDLDFSLSGAEVQTKGNTLIASTGSVERIWELNTAGLRTLVFRKNDRNIVFSNDHSEVVCDWSYKGIINKHSKARLIALTAQRSTDEGFTSEHIRVEAEFEYPEVETFIKYVIWVYPGASGIRTQLFIKGKGAAYLNKDEVRNEDVGFELVKGALNSNYKASAFAALPIASVTEDENEVQYHIKGLSSRGNYRLGFTWWDFEGSGISQNVLLTSVDGEIQRASFENVQLPNFKKNGTGYEMNVIDIPKDLLLDGSFRVIFEKTKGKKAVVSELFIYEEGGKKRSIRNGLDERIDSINKFAPRGFILIGYVDCGALNTGDRLIPTGRVDIVPFSPEGSTIRFAGYYNDTQHRNKPETPLIREVDTVYKDNPVHNNWSSLAAIMKEHSGLVLVKESHKCVNQYGNDTGEFEITKDGVINTGTGLFPLEIKEDEYSWCWASWSIIYEGGIDQMEQAVKTFDRIRYPVDKRRDIYMQANTWGSDRGRNASREKNVLIELESQEDLGIDIQQIDDGWQAARIKLFDPQIQKEGADADREWHVRKDWYPEGWKNVVAKSEETGVKLGLWGAAQPITLSALKWNYDRAGFITYKLDFADLGTHQQMDDLISKVRTFIKYTGHQVRVNWDVTENAPRYGYYWAKEYGCVYLENRKPKVPKNAIYVPHLVLRDVWQLSKYTNVNRFQITIQNIDMVDQTLSDAYQHEHPYAVAIGLVGTPLFFQETHFYSEQARDAIKPLLSVYREHREEMYEQFVYPIGDEPNNDSWTGFQWSDLGHTRGYLMVFREIHNAEQEHPMKVRFMKNRKIRITNLMTGTSEILDVNDQGMIPMNIENQGDYRFYRYEAI